MNNFQLIKVTFTHIMAHQKHTRFPLDSFSSFNFTVCKSHFYQIHHYSFFYAIKEYCQVKILTLEK
nr:hypothetical protein [Klebsiella oxytoca]